jgi:hypothetical protein
MLDDTAAGAAARSPAGAPAIAAPRRSRRALAGCIALALILHGAFLGGAASWSPTGAIEPGTAAMSVRTVVVDPEPSADAQRALVEAAPVAPPVVVPTPRVPRRPREPMRPAVEVMEPAAEAGARLADAALAPAAASAGAAAGSSAAVTAPEVAASAPSGVAEVAPEPAATGSAVASAEAAASASAAQPPLLAAGEVPPPTYRTRLPPPATLRYEVRRGFLRGTGEIRWRPTDDRYRLVLEARIAGLTLLVQTSEGGIDATGLAPTRFVDQRARRPAQAANFRRDVGTVTYSGPAVEWPLLPGTQDRLSWMIQLAGIAAAEPELLVEGGRIAMVVVGARGEAAVWTLRYAGRESVETVRGTVLAVKLVRDGRGAYDTGAEIWLDPERDYFPAHATLRNSSGAAEYELLLERIEAPP